MNGVATAIEKGRLVVQVLRLDERSLDELVDVFRAVKMSKAEVIVLDLRAVLAYAPEPQSDYASRINWSRRGQFLTDLIEFGGHLVIGCVNGHCRDEALEMALACHLLVITRSADVDFSPGYLPRWGGLVRLTDRCGLEGAYHWFAAGATVREMLERSTNVDWIADEAGAEARIDALAASFGTRPKSAARLLLGLLGQSTDRERIKTLKATLFANEHAPFKPEVLTLPLERRTIDGPRGSIREGQDDRQQDLIALERTPDQDIGRTIFRPRRRDEFEFLMSQGKFPIAGRCIELGSGPGWLAQMLTRYSQVTEVVALDISALSILRWSAALADRIKPDSTKLKYLVRDMNRFREYQSHFDVVIFGGSLHHSSDIPRSLETAYRLLRPGGTVVLFAEHYYPVFGLQQRKLRRLRQDRPNLLWTIPDFSRALSRAGFEAHVLHYCLSSETKGGLGLLKTLAKRGVALTMPWLIGYLQLNDYMMIGHKPDSDTTSPPDGERR